MAISVNYEIEELIINLENQIDILRFLEKKGYKKIQIEPQRLLLTEFLNDTLTEPKTVVLLDE